MSYEKKPGDISVFLNTKRTDENNMPNYNGQALIDDKLYDVSFWLKYPDGKPAFLAGKIKLHEARENTAGRDPIQNPGPGPLENDEPVEERKEDPEASEEVNDLPFVLTIPLAIGVVMSGLLHAVVMLA